MSNKSDNPRFTLLYILAGYILIIPFLDPLKKILHEKDFLRIYDMIFAQVKEKSEDDQKIYQSPHDKDTVIIFDDSEGDEESDIVLEIEEVSEFLEPDHSIYIEDLYEEEDISPIDKKFRSSKRFQSKGLGGSLGDDVEFRIFGRSEIKTSFGYSTYFTKEDAKDDFKRPSSRYINEGFILAPDLNFNIKGKIGKRVLVDVDFNRTEKLSENKVQLKYFALRRREFVREVTIGNIDFNFPNSDFTDFKGFQQKSKKTIGVESKFRKGKFKFHAIGTITRGESETEIFTGRARNINRLLPEYQFERRKYFQIEPFIYYDNLNQAPILNSTSYQRGHPNSLITLTSSPLDMSENFVPHNVNIDPGSLEVWLDDRNSANNQNLNARIKLINSTEIGIFHRLQQGENFKFHNETGRLEFIRGFGQDACIYVRYTRQNSASATADPSARINIDGKIETFIYCGNSINEDVDYDGIRDIETIPDGKTNYDVYEVRGIYDLRAQNIQTNDFFLTLLDRNLATISDINDLNKINIDYNLGIVSFFLREPFKTLKDSTGTFLLNDSDSRAIYAENPLNASENSQFNIRANFSSEVQSYQLKHSHILENSVKVKVDGIEVDPKLYRVDYLLGFFYFTNNKEPVITPTTRIEITYEYSPFGLNNRGFIVGLRSEYQASKDFSIGNTVLYNGQFEQSQAPRLGEEPNSRFLVENDIKINLNEKRITRIFNLIPGVDFDLLPIRYKFYGEYVHSFFNPNTYGRALVDDLETSEERVTVSVSEKDWVLSSVPPSLNSSPCDRAPLFYRYYRDLDNVELGPTPLSTGSKADPLYQNLAGPYNVAEGHLNSAQIDQSERQISLVLDFDFLLGGSAGGTPFVSLVTRKFSSRSDGEDLSQMEYLEFSAKLIDDGNLSDGVSIRFDMGTINEDSDNDSQFDTEDVGLDGVNNDINGDDTPDEGNIFEQGEKNGRLDSVNNGYNEDIGYEFNSPSSCSSLKTRVGAGPNISDLPRTRGNGVLNTEDLNEDGIFSKNENVLTIDENPIRDYFRFDTSAGLSNTNIIRRGDWNLVRIYLDPSKLDENQLNAIKHVKSIRMYLVPNGSSSRGKGRLLIDNIKFGGSKWRQKRIGISGIENDLTDPDILQIATIDTEDSGREYKPLSFIDQNENDYEFLHGKKTDTERSKIREAALKISYNFDDPGCGSNCEYVYVRRIFTTPLDLRYYGKINIWIRYIDISRPEDVFFIRLGSSDDDYIEFSSKIDNGGWKLLSFDLPDQKNSNDCSIDGNFKGCPNLKKINTMGLGIKKESSSSTGKGTVWVNDIFMSEPKVQSDNSYKISNYIRFVKPVYKTKGGISIFDNTEVLYERKHQGSRFFTFNQAFSNISSLEDNVQVSSDVMPWWRSKYKYFDLQTEADEDEFVEQRELDGKSRDFKHETENHFQFDNKYLPVILTNYTYREFSNRKTRILNEQSLQEEFTLEKTHTPLISIEETTPEFFYQRIRYNLKANTEFLKREQDIHRITEGSSQDTFENKIKKEQRDNIDTKLIYEIDTFYIQLAYLFKQNVLVQQNFANNENTLEVGGDFYFPFFISSSDFSYQKRESDYGLKLTYNDLWIISPSLDFKFQYQENSFRDNESSIIARADKFQRFKQPNSFAKSNFDLKVDPKKQWPVLKFIHLINFGFFRELTLFESSVPFSRESRLMDDEFGLKSRFRKVGDRPYNIFRYPIWHHFLSKDRHRNNFSNGRNFIQSIDFKPKSPSSEFDEVFERYTQELNLKENIFSSIDWKIHKWLSIKTEANIGQNIHRNGNIDVNPIHTSTIGASIRQNYDLMQILNFWFWYTPSKDKTTTTKYSRRSSDLELNFTYQNEGEITNNIVSHKYTPDFTITFNWFDERNTLNALSMNFSITFAQKDETDYIVENSPPEDRKIYLELIERVRGSREDSIETRFSILFSIGLFLFGRWIKDLTGLNFKRNPKYSIEFIGEFKRFDYEIVTNLSTSASDAYILEQKLDINLHKNVAGDIFLKTALEILRDPTTNEIRQRIFGLEFGLSVRVIF